jgi:hypothetical protein
MTRDWFRILTALAISFLLPECKQAAPLRPQFAYVSNYYSNLVSAYSIDSQGALIPVPGSPFGLRNWFRRGLDARLRFTICNRSRADFGSGGRHGQVRLCGIINHSSKNVSAFRIGSNGSLTPVPGSPFPAGVGPFQWRGAPQVSSPTWQTGAATTSRLTASAPAGL